MKYLSCSDVSKSMGFSIRRIQQMCKNGELPGAIKEGRKWLIPDETIHMNHFAKNKSLPIGVSDFKLATTGYYYVDKTLMIRDFLDKKPMVSLFTRPRRFGKTLNMDMLRVFFEKTNEDTSVYFKDKSPYHTGDEADGFVFEINPDIGAFVAVDGIYHGLIPKKELFSGYRVGDEAK